MHHMDKNLIYAQTLEAQVDFVSDLSNQFLHC